MSLASNLPGNSGRGGVPKRRPATIASWAAVGIIAAVILVLTGCPSPLSDTPTNANLLSLSISNATLEPGFSPANRIYTASVPFEINLVEVSAETEDIYATVTSGTGQVDLQVGTNNLNVVVEAEAGNTRTYTVVITRGAYVASQNADLDSLTLSGATFGPAFSGSTTSYTASVSYDVASVMVSATCADPKASIVSGTGSAALTVGANSLSVIVEAEAGNTRTYTVVVTRAPEPVTPRTFRAQRVTDGGWYDVPASLLAARGHVLVYVEDGESVSAATAGAIADEFEANIYGTIRESFGNEPDVDENGQIILLLLDIVDGFTGSGGYVAGYFSSTHLFSTSTYPDSNMADMLFMDVYPAIPASASFYGTAAHEMQHLVNFTNTYLVDGREQDIWINEGLSSGAEYLYAGEHIASKISYYNADPIETIRNGNNFFVWNGYWEQVYGDVLADYSTVYLFFQWLRIHASNDSGIYKDILSSSSRDYQAVVSAASSRISGSLSTWEVVLRSWLQANFLNMASGLQGYAGEIATVPWNFYNTGGMSRLLSSGESLVVQTDGGSYTYSGGSGSSIRYNGMNSATGAVDTVGSVYTGDAVLVFNSNSLIAAADQTAMLPLVETVPLRTEPAASFVLANQIPTSELPETYPIDVTFGPDGALAPDSHRVGQPPLLQNLLNGDARAAR